MSRRSERVGDLLRAELSNLLMTRVSDPRVRLTTVTSVQVSGDLRQARVLLSVLGEESARQESLNAVRHATGFLRAGLARELRQLRSIPRLVFELDRSAEHSQQISQLLEAIHDHDERS